MKTVLVRKNTLILLNVSSESKYGTRKIFMLVTNGNLVSHKKRTEPCGVSVTGRLIYRENGWEDLSIGRSRERVI